MVVACEHSSTCVIRQCTHHAPHALGIEEYVSDYPPPYHRGQCPHMFTPNVVCQCKTVSLPALRKAKLKEIGL